MRTIELTTLALLSTLSLGGCSSETGSTGQGGAGGAGPIPTSGPTFYKDVKPVLQQHCEACHSPGQIAPFSLITYEEAKAVAALSVVRTQDGSMPPWGALSTDECKPRFGWQHDRRLTEAELATLKAWSDNGAPEGDPKDAPPPRDTSKDLDLTKIDLTLQPPKPFVASGEQDQLICFVLDPKLTKDTYVNASKLTPTNLKVAHHAVVFIDPDNESPAHANADGYYECFGTPGLKSFSLLTPWVPGAGPAVSPPNAGTLIKAGSKLVLQMHYHPAGSVADPDQTKLELQYNTEVPEYRAQFLAAAIPVAIPNGDGLQPGPDDKNGIEFAIPAGASGHTETTRLTIGPKIVGQLGPEMKVYSAMSHMHYVGVNQLITVHRPSSQGADPADECLLQTKWDFNWQQTYVYDTSIEELPTLREGDVIDVRCTYDNTLANPFLKRALLEQKLSAPQDVSYGETTLQEMCIGILSVFIKN
jgi:hypothetical protein